MPRRLLALDLDGTLLRRDHTVDPRDVAAIRRAREAGVYVTLATGRLIGGTLATARVLGLDGEIVCGDGATIANAITGEVIDSRPVGSQTTAGIVRTLLEHGLVPFVFSHGEIHASEDARSYDDWVKIWSEHIHYHPRLEDAGAWQVEGEVAMTLGLGAESAISAAHGVMDRLWGDHVLNTRLGFGERHMLRSFHPANSKGSALERLSDRLGIAREDRAAVGDWFNDLSMFEWASRSFAMNGAPTEVRDAATDRLESWSGAGGGVAEAIDRWLDSAG